MARKVSIELVADYGSVQRGFASVARSGQQLDRSLSHTFRGVVAGSGVFQGLGRSLAFASAGFLAFEGVTATISDSIKGAENLQKAQEGLTVAIQHTGGSVAALEPKYTAIAKGAQQFGISQTDATTALERATVLTGDAAKAQRAYQEALVISKATGKDFNAVLTATSKGQEGVTTSLQRYGILLKKGTPGQRQFNQVMSRFSGQAEANTSTIDKFNATLTNTETILGQTLLPILNQYLSQFGSWLDKMTRTGKLQADVSRGAHDLASVLHAAASTVKVIDRVTGGFANTLKLLLGLKVAAYLRGLSAEWDLVAGSAGRAAVAERAANAATGATAGAAGAAALSARTRANLPSVFSEYAGEGAAGAAALGRTGFASRLGLAKFLAPEALFSLADQGEVQGGRPPGAIRGPGGAWVDPHTGNYVFMAGRRVIQGPPAPYIPGSPIITPQLRSFRPGSVISPSFLPLPAGFAGGSRSSSTTGPFGTAQPLTQFSKQFNLTFREQLAQASAQLTKTTTDDAQAARQVVSRIKKLISQGRLHGQALVQALGLEASALSTIWSSEDQVAQARAAAAQKAKERAQAQLENLIDPIKLEVQLSKAEAFSKPTVGILRQLRASAEKALATGKLSLQQQKEAYDQIASLNQQITASAASAGKDFTVPLKLQLAYAKAQALGSTGTQVLQKMKAAAEKALKSGKLSVQGQIDAWDEIASLNQQLGDSIPAGRGSFKQASTKALTAGLGLDAAQRKALRARLSQLGPGGTVPMAGVGAYGYVIDPNTDRPIHLHVDLDGKKVARSVTVRQQRRSRRNPPQRRGSNAGG